MWNQLTLKMRWRPRNVKGQESQRLQQSLGKGGAQEAPVLELYIVTHTVLSQPARMKASHSPISEDEAAVT